MREKKETLVVLLLWEVCGGATARGRGSTSLQTYSKYHRSLVTLEKRVQVAKRILEGMGGELSGP